MNNNMHIELILLYDMLHKYIEESLHVAKTK